MSIARTIASDLGRALAVLAMLFLCLAGQPADAATDNTVLQQAGATSVLQSLCGGHDQPQLGCHAPNACCRPDQAILPPNVPAAEPAFRGASAVAYAMPQSLRLVRPIVPNFRSRAPPV